MMNRPEKGTVIGEELADVFYFILRFLRMNNFDLSDELERKIEKNTERYLVKKSRDSNKKYNEF